MVVTDGLVAVVKKDCPTCRLVEPVLAQIEAAGLALTVFSQDEPDFPRGVSSVADDRELSNSFRLGIDTVPTLLRLSGGSEAGRAEGWHRGEWEQLSGLEGLGPSLSAEQPGCGSMSVDPGMAELLEVRFGSPPMRSRSVTTVSPEDPVEVCYARGWSDGLPVVPPTPERVLRMLKETTRDPAEVVGLMPPSLAPCSVEKVAVNAVMAGARPEYLPVVLAAVEAALDPAFCMHGLLCTTYFSAPVVVVNGPVTRRIGMNWGVNALGQGNRANATIGRALQLVVRNVGGGIPGGIDRATLGTPGKYTYCFAEDETDPDWPSLASCRGVPAGRSAVTLFGGGETIGNFDQASRDPESLARSLALTLNTAGHPKKALAHDAMLVLSPEHHRIFHEAGWDRARILAELESATERDVASLRAGVDGVAEGLSADAPDGVVRKFREGGLQIVRAGGEAGLMSAVIVGWAASGERGSEPVTREIAS